MCSAHKDEVPPLRFAPVGMTANKIAYLQLAAAIVLFGLAFPIIKIGLAASTPVWLAAGRASLSALTAFALLAVLGRLRWPDRADWPIVLSVGVFQLTLYFAFANLGVQSVPPGRSGVLAYSAMLWLVPLSLLVGEHVGRRALLGVALGMAGIVVLIDPPRFDWSDRAVVEGHGWLLLAGFSWALAILHARRHRWRTAPLDVLPWQMAVATVLLWSLALILEPKGYFDFSKPDALDLAALYRLVRRPGRHLGRRLRRPRFAAGDGLARHAGHAADRHRRVRGPGRRTDHWPLAAGHRADDRGHCYRDPGQEEATDEGGE